MIAKSLLGALLDTPLLAPTLRWVVSEHRRLAAAAPQPTDAAANLCTEQHVLLRTLAQLTSRGRVSEVMMTNV